jgi:hypothetical protein
LEVLAMMNPAVVALRADYEALVKAADGFLSVIRAGAACNLLTMARLADEARSAARKVAAQIEQLCRGVFHPLARFAAALVDVVKASLSILTALV